VTAADVIVIVLGVALIAGELWFFLGPRPAAGRAESEERAQEVAQEVRIVVRDGYDPDTILVEAGRPARLLFYRDETSECSERVVFETLGIERELPAFETTAVDFPPVAPGDYPFRCGKGVMEGRVVAQVGGDGARAHLGEGHRTHG